MGKQQKLVQKPMLYITQPEFAPSEAPMQTTYHGKKRVKEEGKQAENKSADAGVKRERQHSNKEAQMHQEPQEKAETEAKQSRAGSARDRRQRFRDMTLEEKVTYFVNLPSQIPKMKCEVVTAEEKYRGYINNYQDGIVYMKTFKRPFQKEIDFREIEDISLIGF
ncbi:CotO family spore coat protein [Thalassobacillus devorans]|uniref:CotO family spore coat protein n=1 Tax=Thalassobacillus devorans TaxID=279813 RepID=UPI000A1CA323|nr:CotO family spore coat protein [Thalassobacillus devorans]